MQKTKVMKESLSLILAVIMVFTMLPMKVFAAESDISGHWAEDTLQNWFNMGWFIGDGNGIFRPNSEITRAEFMALVNRMKGYNGSYTGMSNYTDVSFDKWYYSTVSAALEAGYITGINETTISPEHKITRQEVMTIIARIAGVETDDITILSSAIDGDSVADWAKATVAACVSEGLVAGSEGKINPTLNITRAEAVTLLDRIFTDTRTYSFAGTYGSATSTTCITNVNIIGADVHLQNMTIEGNLSIEQSVDEGEVYLTNVNVEGTLNVRGGGRDSIYINNCIINELIIEKKKVHILLDGTSTVSFARIEGDDDFIELKGKTTLGVLTIVGEETLMKMESSVSITTLNINADGISIETVKGTNIGTANINGSAEITGMGLITTANISSENVTIESKPTNTNVNEGITSNVGGEDVTGAFPSTGTGSGGSSGGNGGTTTITYLGHNISPKTVEFGTQVGDLDLPKLITLSANTGAVGTADVSWDYSTYNPYVAATHTVTGILSNASVIWAPKNITLTVTVSAALTVENGTDFDPIIVKSTDSENDVIAKLPTNVVLMISDGSSAVVNLKWTVNGSYSNVASSENTFNAKVVGLSANVIVPIITVKVLIAATDIPIVSRVELTALPGSVERPQDATNATVILKAVVKDQFDDEMNEDVTYSLVNNTDTEISYGLEGALLIPTITITENSIAKSVTAKVEVDRNTDICDEVSISISDDALVATTIKFIDFVSDIALPSIDTTTYTFTAAVYDQNGSIMGESVTYSIKFDETGIAIASNGTVTVDLTAENGVSFFVVAKAGNLYAEKLVTVKKAASVATSISVIKGNDSITLPVPGAEPNTAVYSATLLDQYHTVMNGIINWSVEANGTNVYVNSQGIVFVEAGSTATNATLKAQYSGLKEQTKSISINKASSVATSISVSGDDIVYLPGMNELANTKTYTAIISDQYGDTMNGVVTWSISGANGVSIDSSNGVLNVPNTAETGTVTIVATVNEISCVKTVNLTKSSSVLTTITVSGPAAIAPGNIGSFSAITYDQYGDIMIGKTFVWSIVESIQGIEITNSGIVSVQGIVAEGTSFTIRAEIDGINGTANCTISQSQLDMPQNVRIAVYGDYTFIEWDAVENAERYVVQFIQKANGRIYEIDINSDQVTSLNLEVSFNTMPQDTYMFKIYAKADGYMDSETSPVIIETVTTSIIGSALEGFTAKFADGAITVNGTFEIGRGYHVSLFSSESENALGSIIVFAESTTVLIVDHPSMNDGNAITVQTHTIGGSGGSYTITYTPRQNVPILIME